MRLAMTAPADDNPHATTLLAALLAAGEQIACVIVTKQGRLSRFVQYARAFGLGQAVRLVFTRYGPAGMRDDPVGRELSKLAVSRQLVDWDRPLSMACKAHGIACVFVDSVSDAAAVIAVRENNVDLLLNTTGEIYRPAMLAAPRVGVLNAHMARLPEFRGMNVLEWSVLCGRPPAVTVHFVTQGIDLGGIVCAGDIPVAEGDTLNHLRAKAIAASVGLLQDAVSQVKRGARTPPPDRPTGRQYFVMHPRLRIIAESRIPALASGAEEKAI